ncbi:ABC transporter permease [Mesorhizobium qingshengii]|uniref:ABC transporter permease n=1 Tax=Mesorhizobium qingshengii TaxID=1165689 RepID=A0ABT4R3E0_9HYPH|nr:ABC transporter permease [Mesorhizobium qingshengii]MCZ8548354.1 ABC transporter permease [Mesorhizobium qingshengii]
MIDTVAAVGSAPRRRLGEASLLAAAGWAFIIFITTYMLIPVLVTAVMSFNSAAMVRFPLSGFSLRWYAGFLASPLWMDALWNSIVVALGTTVVSASAGILAAWAFSRYDLPFKNLLYLLIMMPLFLPGVVLGLGLAITFGGVQIAGVPLYGSRFLVVLGHSLWAMPLVFLLMEATFRTVDKRIVEASGDLGAGPVRTFFEIVLPMVSTGVFSSMLFALVISLNEFMMALFLTNRDTQTLPVLMWLSLRSAGTPNLAVAAVVLAVTVFASLTLIALWHIRSLRRA